MSPAKIDHLVVTAPSLDVGLAYIQRTLGVTPQPGGEHPRMGTHNCVLKLGHRVYLEVIAVNPEAPEPNRPRWFELDKPNPGQTARLAAWVARTHDIRTAAAAAPEFSGDIEPMRRGALQWDICGPTGGRLILGGIAPMLIQWQDVHPADTLKDMGCSLAGLEGFHPEPAQVKAVLDAINFQGDFSISASAPGKPPYLVAHIQTPMGRRVLGTS